MARTLINKLEHNTDAGNSSASHIYGTRSSNNIFQKDLILLFVSVLIHICIASYPPNPPQCLDPQDCNMNLHSTLHYHCFKNHFNVILLPLMFKSGKWPLPSRFSSHFPMSDTGSFLYMTNNACHFLLLA